MRVASRDFPCSQNRLFREINLKKCLFYAAGFARFECQVQWISGENEIKRGASPIALLRYKLNVVRPLLRVSGSVD